MKHLRAISAAVILAAAISPKGACANALQATTVSIMHVASVPNLTAGAAWPAGSEIVKTNGIAPHATSVYVIYDDADLCVKFVCEQNGTPIISNQIANDVGFGLDVNGAGGYARPGLNLAADLHKRFDNGDLYFEYGAPAAIYTLQRFILKYVFSVSGGSD